MSRLSTLRWLRSTLAVLLPLAASLFTSPTAQAQLYQPEGLHMPGSWNGYTNLPDPVANYAIRGTNTNNCGTGTNICTSGGINKVAPPAGGYSIYQTTIHAAASGGDFTGNTYSFLFTSGPGFGGQYNNTWKGGVTVAMNTLQSYAYQSGGDASITLVNGNYYTMNWLDNGYGTTQAIFMQTSAAPVSLTNVTQSPVAGSVTPTNSVAATVTLSAPKSAEENVFIVYSTNNFTSGTVVQASGSGTSYTATIPAQTNGTTVQYYAMTSTVSAATLSGGPFEGYALRYKNNGGSIYAYTSASLPPVNITFRVDMQNESVSGGGVHLPGTFNGYSTSAITLTQEGSTTIYSAVVPLAQGSNILYKFYNGSYEDNIGAPCGTGSDRTYTVGSTDATIALTCYSKCGACPPLHPVTFQVDAQNEANVTSMHLSGEFNGYNTTATPMTNVSGTLWTVTLNLQEGRGYSYKFVENSGNYEDNIPAGTCNPGGAGGGNRNYTVTTSASQTIPVACFSACGACAALSTVTMSVDMRDQNVTNGVVLSGNFNSYNTTATPMNRLGTSSVYTVTIVRPEGYALSYKFVNGNGSNNYEPDPGVACGPNNRAYTVPTGNSTISTVCFGSCSACPPKYNVTFRVNMANQVVTGPVILKDFTSGSVDYVMTLEAGTTYKVVANLTAGTHIFKFFNTGGSNGGYENNIGTPCGNGSNRTYTVSGGAVAPTYCYNSCIDCGATNVFTGATSTDFNTGSNWNSGLVPSTCADNVQINGTGIQPSIAAAANFSIGSLALMSGANLSLGAGATLSVCGNLSGTGGQTVGGTVIVNGSSTQTMTGTATFDNLTVSKTGGQGNLNVTGNARINSNLTLANATSNLVIAGGGSVTLASSASGTGRLATVPSGATITGNLTLERYVSGTAGWRFVGAPFTSSTLISDWNEDAVRVSPKNNANVFAYTEADTTRGTYNGSLTERAGWKVPASLSNPINPGNVVTGYRLYISSTLLNYSKKLITSGTPFTGDKSIPYTFSPATGWDGGGWNLLANPYPSDVDWAAAAFDGSNAAAPKAITTYNSASSTYASYTATSATGGIAVNGGQRYIASSQGFFLKATSAGTLTFKETHKGNSAASSNSFFRTGNENTLTVRFTQGTSSDEAAIAFLPVGLLGRDQFDADNMAGPDVDISTHPVAGLNLAINVMPAFATRYEVPVSFTAAVGQMSASFSGLESFPADARIYLRDNYLSTLTELTATSAVTFDVTTNAATQGTARFTLVFVPNAVTAAKEVIAATAQLNVWPNPSRSETKLHVSLNHFGGSTALISLTDMTGKTVYTRTVTTDAQTVIDTQGLPAGIYALKAAGAEQTLQQRVVIQ